MSSLYNYKRRCRISYFVLNTLQTTFFSIITIVNKCKSSLAYRCHRQLYKTCHCKRCSPSSTWVTISVLSGCSTSSTCISISDRSNCSTSSNWVTFISWSSSSTSFFTWVSVSSIRFCAQSLICVRSCRIFCV